MTASDYAMLIFELNFFVEEYNPTKKEFTPKEYHIIQNSIKFFKLVILGLESITSVRGLITDVNKLDAYALADRAIKTSFSLGKLKNSDKKKLFIDVITFLDQLLNQPNEVTLSEKKIQEIRQFINQLAKIVYSMSLPDEPVSLIECISETVVR